MLQEDHHCGAQASRWSSKLHSRTAIWTHGHAPRNNQPLPFDDELDADELDLLEDDVGELASARAFRSALEFFYAIQLLYIVFTPNQFC